MSSVTVREIRPSSPLDCDSGGFADRPQFRNQITPHEDALEKVRNEMPEPGGALMPHPVSWTPVDTLVSPCLLGQKD